MENNELDNYIEYRTNFSDIVTLGSGGSPGHLIHVFNNHNGRPVTVHTTYMSLPLINLGFVDGPTGQVLGWLSNLTT